MATRVRAPRFVDSGLFQHTLCLEYIVLFENTSTQVEWKKKYNRGDYTYGFHGTTFANGISIGNTNFDIGRAKDGFFFSKWVPIALKYAKSDDTNRYPVLVAKIAGKFSPSDTFWKIMDSNLILPKCLLIYCPENLIEPSMKKVPEGMHDSDAEL